MPSLAKVGIVIASTLLAQAIGATLFIGLYAHPPNLAQEDTDDALRVFWIIKHGIKMSAMPAWGRSLNDDAIWDIVLFV